VPKADNKLVSYWVANKRTRSFAAEKLPKTLPNLMSGNTCYNVRKRPDWNRRNGFGKNYSISVTTDQTHQSLKTNRSFRRSHWAHPCPDTRACPVNFQRIATAVQSSRHQSGCCLWRCICPRPAVRS
jgi:hypothetical protein